MTRRIGVVALWLAAGGLALHGDELFVSHTMGERVTCSLLRGAGELTGRPELRGSYERCALFPNDSAFAPPPCIFCRK